MDKDMGRKKPPGELPDDARTEIRNEDGPASADANDADFDQGSKPEDSAAHKRAE